MAPLVVAVSLSSLVSLAPLADKEVFAADASAPTVVLLRLPSPDEVTTEAMARVNGELKAAGFEVAVVPFRGDDAKKDLESAAREMNAIAAFAIFVRPFEEGATVAEIWVSDRTRQKLVIQNAVLHETDRGRGSEILAVRAVELLKASLADFWMPASAPPVPPPAPPQPSPPAAERPPTRAPFAGGLGAGLGIGVAASCCSVARTPPSWSPDATASYGWPHGLGLRATFAGLGPDATFSATDGSAKVGEQFAILEVVKAWWPTSALVPFAAVGSGAQHVHVVGSGNAPYQGHTLDRWSVLTTIGVGIAIPLLSTVSLVAQARGLASWSPTVVDVAGVEVGRAGAPSVRVDAGLFGTVP
ncbi:MAG TPA: hypothetical protein VK762_35130 [Polyangiaceae bacterium]|nr:hypothetical protein [Polyangiaceae bacterium]